MDKIGLLKEMKVIADYFDDIGMVKDADVIDEMIKVAGTGDIIKSSVEKVLDNILSKEFKTALINIQSSALDIERVATGQLEGDAAQAVVDKMIDAIGVIAKYYDSTSGIVRMSIKYLVNGLKTALINAEDVIPDIMDLVEEDLNTILG